MLLSGILYYLTLAPSVVQIDSGELAAVQSLLGIAHPTGYPLFSMLGYLFLKIPLSDSKIFQLNILSLIWCVLGIFIIIKSIHLCLSSITLCHPRGSQRKYTPPRQKSKSHRKNNADPILFNIAACLTSGLYLAFSKTFWLQATSVEVYSLHITLISIVLYFLIKAWTTDNSSSKPWIYVAIALALGFSNHMTTLLILPGMITLFFAKRGFCRSALKPMIIMIGVFISILCLIHLYLPLRAAQNPVLNWGNPVNWNNILRHVSGKQYRVWLFSSSQAAMKNLGIFFHNFPDEFTWIGLFLGLLGLYSSFIKIPRLAIFFLITSLSTVLYSINYDIHDLDSYFLLVYIVFAIWITFGVRWILYRIRGKSYRVVFLSLLAIGVTVEAIQNFSRVDRSGLYVFEDYTKQALNSLPNNAVLLSYQWDYLISPAYYFQFVENFRKDVAIIDKELLRRSWYFDQLTNNYPQIMQKVESEVDSFLKALEPFERGGDFNPNLIERGYRGLIARLIETNALHRTVYIAPELVEGEFRRGELYLPRGIQLVPDLFFFRVVTSNEYRPLRNVDVAIRFPTRGNHYSDVIKNFISKMFTWRALYELQFGKTENARTLKRIIQTHFPNFQFPQSLRDI